MKHLSITQLFVMLIGVVVFNVCFSSDANAQWNQMGPGGGGQVRAVYLWSNGNSNKFYVASDVSGVWVTDPLTTVDLTNSGAYVYHYISNHEIMKYVTKFYPLPISGSNYILVCSGNGIHSIDRTNANGDMKKILAMDNSWVSDLFMYYLSGADYRAYLITGNTRVDDDVANNAKSNATYDFYWSTYNSTSNSFTTPVGANLQGMPSRGDVYCFTVNENSSIQDDDEFLLGTEKGLYHFSWSDINTTTHTVTGLPGQAIEGPTTDNYQVTSIVKTNTTDKYLVTIYELGVYLYDVDGPDYWTPLVTNLFTKPFNSLIPEDKFGSISRFTKLLRLENETGFLLFTDDPDYQVGNTHYFTGVFYTPDDGTAAHNPVFDKWESIDVSSAASDFGWIGSKPCANMNSAVVTPDYNLLLGKSGNLFVTAQACTTATDIDWKQIYTTATSNSNGCTTSSLGDAAYNHKGFVNTVSKCIYPDQMAASGRIWLGDFDRGLIASNFAKDKFTPVTQTNTKFCMSLDISSISNVTVCGGDKGISDCSFITSDETGSSNTKLYAGLGEGYSISQGRGYIYQWDVTSTNYEWEILGEVVCGDPLKLIFDSNGKKYALFNEASTGLRRLYYLDETNPPGTWNMLSNFWGGGTNEDLADAIIDADDYLYVIRSKGPNKGLYRWSGSNTNWTSAGSTLLGETCNKLVTYKDGNNSSHVICGTSGGNNISDCLYWVNGSTNSSISNLAVDANCGSVTAGDNFQNLSDDGVTAISVNTVAHSIYVSTIKFDNTIAADKAFIYKGSYDAATGAIDDCWMDITDDLPNKATVYSISTGGNGDQLYVSSKGIGEWNRDICSMVLTTYATITSCNANGSSATVVANPISGTYTYSWSDATTQTTATATGLNAGTYTVTVNNGTCTAKQTITIASVNVSMTMTPVSCNTSTTGGQATATGYDGKPPYTYLWSSSQTTATITGLNVGTYTVTVTDNNSCPATKSITVTSPPALVLNTITTNVVCSGGSSGSIQAVAWGGIGAYTYLWSNAQTKAIATALVAATYTVTVTDANGCTITATASVSTVAAAITGNTSVCPGKTTTLTASAGASYVWSNGATTQSVLLNVGTISETYTVTVTDATPCTSSATIAIAPYSITTVTINENDESGTHDDHIVCSGDNATLTANGTYSFYSWSPSNGNNSSTYGTGNLTATTTYTVVALDGNGCTSSATSLVIVSAYPTPTITGTSPICNGANSNFDAGSGFTTYFWSTSETSQTINVNANGNYTVTVANASGCTASVSKSLTVNSNPSPTITGLSAICAGNSTSYSTGSFTSYLWSTGATTNSIAVNTTGNYTVTVTDGNGCTGSVSKTLTVNSNPSPTISGLSAICAGGSTSYSTGSFTSYLWSTGATTSSIIVNTTGNYTVTVTDGNGCTGSVSKTLTVNANPTPSITGPSAVCDGSSGTFNAGNGFANYLWLPGTASTQTISVSVTGTYTVYVTDGNGCTASATKSLTVNSNPTPTIAGTSTICAGQTTTFNAGTFVTYTWSPGGAHTQTISASSAGNYTVIVTDGNGCSGSASITLTVNALPILNFSIAEDSHDGSNDGLICLGAQQ